MTMFRMTATRADGSTRTSTPHVAANIPAMVAALLACDTPPANIAIWPDDPRVDYADSGPIQTLDAAMKWRQPADDITRILY